MNTIFCSKLAFEFGVLLLKSLNQNYCFLLSYMVVSLQKKELPEKLGVALEQ